MTMINGVLQGGAAYLYGDTALIDPATGCVLAFDCKIRTRANRHFPWAVGVTAVGNYGAQLAALELFDAKRVDDMVEQMPIVITTFRELSALHHEHPPIIGSF